MSLFVLDFLVSPPVGRPAALASRPSGLVPLAKGHGASCSLALDAIYSLFVNMDSLLRDTTREKGANFHSANIVLKGLQDWSTQLDPRLGSVSPSSTSGALDRNSVIGNVHLACFGYFTVILLARPYLVHHLLSEERLDPGQGSEGVPSLPPSMAPNTSAETSELAKTCVDAAVFLLEICHYSVQKGLLLNNMCLFQ